MNAATRSFIRHYVEMVAAMVVGMVVLGAAAAALLDLPDRAAVTLTQMGITMTGPMVAWMRIRGHGWRSSGEMAASMLIPTTGTLMLLWTGVVTGAGTLLAIEHVVMLPSMLVAMLLRHDEYTGHHHRGRPHVAT